MYEEKGISGDPTSSCKSITLSLRNWLLGQGVVQWDKEFFKFSFKLFLFFYLKQAAWKYIFYYIYIYIYISIYIYQSLLLQFLQIQAWFLSLSQISAAFINNKRSSRKWRFIISLRIRSSVWKWSKLALRSWFIVGGKLI